MSTRPNTEEGVRIRASGQPPIRVLLVDDEQDVAEMAAEFLERMDADLEVDVETDATIGLERVRAGTVDCVVSDYQMPGMNGIEFLMAVRERHDELPFILFTGKGSEEVASDAFSAGATDYLQKESGTDQYELLANRIRQSVVHHRRERELRRYENIVKAAGDGVYTLDAEGHFTSVNDAIVEQTGYARPDLLRAHVSTVLDDESVERGQAAISDLIATDDASSTTIELTVVTQDGASVPAEVTIALLPPDGSAFHGTVGIARDISERKERERDLERYETILERVDDGVYVLDEDGRYTYVNSHIAEQTGYDRDELLGARPTTHISEDAVDDFERAIRALLSGDRTTYALEFEVQPADGDPYPAEAKIAPLVVDGTFEGTIGVVRDLTKRKERERELKRQNDRLEEFASVVSHDLRTPLTLAGGRLAKAREDCHSEHLDGVAAAHDRMDALINDLLTLAREGGAVTDPEPVDLRDLAVDTWADVHAPAASLETTDAGVIRAEEDRLRQLLENLFWNAVEHGGPAVAVRVEVIPDGFTVADNGPGVPEADRETVFDTGYSTASEGTGLGLRIVQRFAAAHGWDVTVTDSEDGGARIEFTNVDVVA